MKNINIFRQIIILLIVGSLTFTACNDWLDVEPDDVLIKEKFWQKTSDVYGALAATYSAMRRSSLQSIILGECRADLVVFSGPSVTNYAQIAASNISPNNSAVNWGSYYEAINLANTLMYYNKIVFEKDKTFTQEMLNGVDAEALFIRSLAYFYLVRLWKDVPLVLNPSLSDTTDLYLAKSSEKVVIQQIINDLLKAKDLAYTTQFKGTNSFYGRANKYSIMALLADVYLWDQQYQNCLNYCDSVSLSGHYGLEDTETWFRVYYPGNSAREAIFEFQYDDQLENQSNPIYNNIITTFGTTQVGLNLRTTNILLNQEDARRFGGKSAIWKYRGKDALGIVQRTSTEEDANWIIYRYADIMLMKAEASIELNQFDIANSLIRETLLRAGLPYEENFEKEILREALLNERGREFLLEGKRWFDVLRSAKRNGFANKSLIIDMILSGADVKQQAVLRTKVYDTLSYYLPIAERELIYNQKLKQNPYYER
jgi:starch-binding outer membrane protein, SusD/RagB family